MNLFSQSVDRAKPEQIQQIKAWMYEIMALDKDIAISINQLQCREPGCPPLEHRFSIHKFKRRVRQGRVGRQGRKGRSKVISSLSTVSSLSSLSLFSKTFGINELVF